MGRNLGMINYIRRMVFMDIVSATVSAALLTNSMINIKANNILTHNKVQVTDDIDFKQARDIIKPVIEYEISKSVEPVTEEVVETIESEPVVEDTVEVIESEPTVEVAQSYNESSLFSYDEKYLMAKVCLAEAEDQTELGKRLVISTILNRIDSDYYPDDVYSVVYQPYQFEVMSNGRIDRVTVTDDVMQLVEEEIQNRTNYDVIYFRMDYYSEYGTPLFVEDDHYFSGF